MKQKFFRQNNKWYADVPNHTMEDNEMIMGSDVLLDALSDGKYNTIELELTDTEPNCYYELVLIKTEHDEDGAYYNVDGPLYRNNVEKLISVFGENINTIWICNVTHDVFGEHPDKIFVLNVTRL